MAKTLKGPTVFASTHPFCEKPLNILYQINVLVYMEKNYRDRVTEIHVDQLITRCQNISLILQYLVSILRRPRKRCKTNKQTNNPVRSMHMWRSKVRIIFEIILRDNT